LSRLLADRCAPHRPQRRTDDGTRSEKSVVDSSMCPTDLASRLIGPSTPKDAKLPGQTTRPDGSVGSFGTGRWSLRRAASPPVASTSTRPPHATEASEKSVNRSPAPVADGGLAVFGMFSRSRPLQGRPGSLGDAEPAARDRGEDLRASRTFGSFRVDLQRFETHGRRCGYRLRTHSDPMADERFVLAIGDSIGDVLGACRER
jgi:hypothetical protein